jgi:multiple sugar transport system ATP-binding protein
MARVCLERIVRKFETHSGVEEISFEVPDGEFWVLVGPSGCGKSTILRMIAGLETASAGNIYIGDRQVNQIPARLRDVAMVFQNYALYPHMSVAENLAFGLRMRQTNPETLQSQVQAVAKSLDIAHLLERKPRQLSGGQQQRVALGRAIARSPQVFLLDEPLSNLDTQLRDETRAELKQLHQRLGITTIYVTHDQVEAMTLADKIVVLNRGRIQQIGTPQQIYNQPKNRMVASFIGNPAMNLLQAVYNGQEFQLERQSLPCPTPLVAGINAAQGLSFELGIRPERLEVMPSTTEAEPGSTCLNVEVQLVEPLGRENLIRVVLPGSSQILNLSSRSDIYPQPGDRLRIKFKLQDLMIFDAKNGEAISSVLA